MFGVLCTNVPSIYQLFYTLQCLVYFVRMYQVFISCRMPYVVWFTVRRRNKRVAHETAICHNQAIRQTVIRALPDIRVLNTPSVNILYPQKNCFSSYFCQNVTCFSVGLSRIVCRVKLRVGGLLTRNGCSMSDISFAHLVLFAVERRVRKMVA
jgi:hypothetical protein